MSSSWTSWPGLAGAYSFIKYRLRNVIVLPGLLCLGLMLASCGEASSPKTSAAPSRSTISGTGPAPANPTLAPLLAPPGSDMRPPEPGSLGRAIGPDGLPAMQPPKGVNVSIDTLFSEDIRDPIERTKRVETAVVEVRRDLDAAMPAIKRLVAVEKDIQLLTSQLQTLLNNEPAPAEDTYTISSADGMTGMPEPLMPAPAEEKAMPDVPAPETQTELPAALPPAEPESVTTEEPPVVAEPPHVAVPPATAPPQQMAKSPEPDHTPAPPQAAPQSGASIIQGIRLGEHAEKTRVVIDISGPVTYTKDIDNMEKLLVIELPEASLDGVDDGIFKSPLVKSWSAQPLESGKGVRIILVLSSEASVIYDHLLGPAPDNPNHRLIIDLKSSAVHSDKWFNTRRKPAEYD